MTNKTETKEARLVLRALEQAAAGFRKAIHQLEIIDHELAVTRGLLAEEKLRARLFRRAAEDYLRQLEEAKGLLKLARVKRARPALDEAEDEARVA